MPVMTDIKQALVIGATGNIGRPVVELLRDRGVAVRGMARDVSGLPEGVDRVGADVRDLDALRAAVQDVDAVLLVWPFMAADGIDDVAAVIGRPGRRVVYVSAMSVRDDAPPERNGVWGQVEDAIRRSGADWTFLRASGFATNTLQWAPAIRAGRPVRAPYLQAARSLIDERDIADVAVVAMTSPGHAGRAYALTGPAAVTQVEQVRLIGAAVGVPVPAEEAGHDEARAEMLSWAEPGFADAALGYWASLVATPEPVTDTVRELTGSPARPFARWARDHAAAFRPLPIEEVARRYVEAFRAGRMDRALALVDPRLVRVAPAETGGERTELHGLPDVMANAERLTADLDIHAVAADGPFVGGDRFAVRFTFDQTHRPTGRRAEATKLCLYTVAGGAIVREEVSYFDPPTQPR
jgi:uncharacterized protein YbjT (DUF2867 family)/ketosteroid isomerase-like protein